MTREMHKGYLKEMLDDAINDIWAQYQSKLGIDDGDCDPLTVFKYDELVEQLAALIVGNEAKKLSDLPWWDVED